MKKGKTKAAVPDLPDFRRERERLNGIVMKYAGPGIKRFYSLDHQAFLAGSLPPRTKELIGLVASLVLRCEDCVFYHLQQCRDLGVKDAELADALNVGLVIGGSITIPMIRRAFAFWDKLAEMPE